MLRHLISGTLALGLATLSTAAVAQNCASREIVVERLASKYSEDLMARGLQEFRTGSAIVEVWASDDTGTFTVLLTNAQGISCVMAAGSHWFEEAKPVQSGKVFEEPTAYGVLAPPEREFAVAM